MCHIADSMNAGCNYPTFLGALAVLCNTSALAILLNTAASMGLKASARQCHGIALLALSLNEDLQPVGKKRLKECDTSKSELLRPQR